MQVCLSGISEGNRRKRAHHSSKITPNYHSYFSKKRVLENNGRKYEISSRRFQTNAMSGSMLSQHHTHLLYEGRFVADQAERAVILRGWLSARFPASDDLDPCTISVGARISWSGDLMEFEVWICRRGSGNTSPRADSISVKLLTTCWDIVGLHVTNFFSCLCPS